MPNEQAQHQLLHPARRFRQATHAPDGTEVSLAEDGHDRSTAWWLHGSPGYCCWRSALRRTATLYGMLRNLYVKHFFSPMVPHSMLHANTPCTHHPPPGARALMFFVLEYGRMTVEYAHYCT